MQRMLANKHTFATATQTRRAGAADVSTANTCQHELRGRVRDEGGGRLGDGKGRGLGRGDGGRELLVNGDGTVLVLGEHGLDVVRVELVRVQGGVRPARAQDDDGRVAPAQSTHHKLRFRSFS